MKTWCLPVSLMAWSCCMCVDEITWEDAEDTESWISSEKKTENIYLPVLNNISKEVYSWKESIQESSCITARKKKSFAAESLLKQKNTANDYWVHESIYLEEEKIISWRKKKSLLCAACLQVDIVVSYIYHIVEKQQKIERCKSVQMR